jgi:hypothetical protein
MYRIPQIPQPYKEDVELMKRGRKRNLQLLQEQKV